MITAANNNLKINNANRNKNNSALVNIENDTTSNSGIEISSTENNDNIKKSIDKQISWSGDIIDNLMEKNY